MSKAPLNLVGLDLAEQDIVQQVADSAIFIMMYLQNAASP